MLPDRYEVHARIVPALLVIAPVVLVAGVLGAAVSTPVATGTIVCAVLLAVALAVSDAVSDRGRELQHRRWEAHGGSPTVRALSADDPAAAERRTRVRELFGIELDGSRASAERASSALRDFVRSQRNERVAEANRNYGRVRNLYALRPFGVTLSAASGLVAFSATVADLDDVSPANAGTAALICAALVAWWVFHDFHSQLDERDRQFTDRLLAALDAAGPRSGRR